MKLLTTRSAECIAQIARSEAGKADFITLLWDNETKTLSLNDAGDIAIPFSTTCSVALEMRWDNECIENIVRGFVGAVESRK
jgi:hypothetical protein